MMKKSNCIILFTLLIVVTFIFGCSSKIKNVPQQKNTEKNKLEQNKIEPNDANQNRTDSNKQSLNENIDENELKSEVERIYNERSAALVSGDVSSLKTLFDTSQKYGQRALEHEVKRVKYLNDWSNERNVTFGKIESTVRIKQVYPKNNIMKLALEESYKFDYVYNNDDTSPINSFGVGIRHTASLVKKNEKWVIFNDWYTDCFKDALRRYSGSYAKIPTSLISVHNINKKTVSYKKTFYDRQKAVAYADKYCGAAWGIGNNFKYNDYNGIGGDCTNYISQVLGDKEGGSMPIGGAWTSGSRA